MEKINKRWVLAKRPEGMPEDECWKLEEASIKDLDENQILIKVMYLSIDPYMRGRMNDMKSYRACCNRRGNDRRKCWASNSIQIREIPNWRLRCSSPGLAVFH